MDQPLRAECGAQYRVALDVGGGVMAQLGIAGIIAFIGVTLLAVYALMTIAKWSDEHERDN